MSVLSKNTQKLYLPGKSSHIFNLQQSEQLFLNGKQNITKQKKMNSEFSAPEKISSIKILAFDFRSSQMK